MNSICRLSATAAFWAILLIVIGVIAYQLGEYHRFALTLHGIRPNSFVFILGMGLLGSAFMVRSLSGNRKLKHKNQSCT